MFYRIVVNFVLFVPFCGRFFLVLFITGQFIGF